MFILWFYIFWSGGLVLILRRFSVVSTSRGFSCGSRPTSVLSFHPGQTGPAQPASLWKSGQIMTKLKNKIKKIIITHLKNLASDFGVINGNCKQKFPFCCYKYRNNTVSRRRTLQLIVTSLLCVGKKNKYLLWLEACVVRVRPAFLIPSSCGWNPPWNISSWKWSVWVKRSSCSTSMLFVKTNCILNTRKCLNNEQTLNENWMLSVKVLVHPGHLVVEQVQFS